MHVENVTVRPTQHERVERFIRHKRSQGKKAFSPVIFSFSSLCTNGWLGDLSQRTGALSPPSRIVRMQLMHDRVTRHGCTTATATGNKFVPHACLPCVTGAARSVDRTTESDGRRKKRVDWTGLDWTERVTCRLWLQYASYRIIFSVRIF